MNILHVVNVFFVLPYFLGDQLKYINSKGHNIHIICSPSEYLKEFAKKQNCQYAEIPILKSYNIRQDIISLIGIIKYIKKHKIDMVIGHTPKGALLSMLAAYFMCVPKRIYFRHGLMYETSKGIERKILIFFEKITSSLSTKIITVSPSVFNKSIEDKLNSKSKMVVIGKGTCGGIDTKIKFNPNNINPSKMEKIKQKLNITDKDYIVGYTGRIVKDKGIVELINAFELLKKDINIKLLLVGDFEKRDSLSQKDILKIKNNSNIILTGFIFRDIEYYYSLMDIFILPSYREGFGMSIIEASSMQIPVFVTKVTGCVDAIVEGRTGFFIERNPEFIYKTILNAKNNKSLKNIGLNGRNWVSNHFDHQIIWPLIEAQIYNT